MAKMALLPAVMKGLTPEMVKKAENELGETPQVKARALEQLKQCIEQVPDFYPRMDEAFLIRFLRSKKYNVNKTLKSLINYYTFKLKYSGILTDFKPSEIRKVMEMNSIISLPTRDPDGSGIGILRFGRFNTNVATPDELMAAILICAEIGLDLEATQVCGSVIIVDFLGVTLKHIANFASPAFFYRVIQCLQDCQPHRIKAYHLVNLPLYANSITQILMKLATSKIRKRVHFHGSNMKSLHEHVPPEILPEELGGTLGPMDNREYYSYLLSKEEEFERFIQYAFKKIS